MGEFIDFICCKEAFGLILISPLVNLLISFILTFLFLELINYYLKLLVILSCFKFGTFKINLCVCVFMSVCVF